MRVGGTAAAWAGRTGEHYQPFRPVAAELEEVVVIGKAERFEIVEQCGERLGIEDRSEGYHVALHTELVRRQTEPLIQAVAHEADTLVRLPPNEQSWRARVYMQRHAHQDTRVG